MAFNAYNIKCEDMPDGNKKISMSYEITQNMINEVDKRIEKELFERLAEMRGYVRQDTCKNVGDNLNMLHEVDQFVCSECRIHLEDWTRIEYDEDWGYPPEKFWYEYTFKFCPNCGRKIVD